MNSATFSQLIVAFCEQLGISDMQPEDNGCTLRLNELLINIHNEEARGEIYLCSPLGQVPTEPEERLRIYAALLESNCFYGRTAGGIFGVSADDDLTFTLKFFADGLNADTLGEIIKVYFETVEEQMRQLQEIAQQPNTTVEAPPSGSVRV